MSAREFYHYFQTDTQHKWQVVTEANKDKHKDLKVKRMSILAVSSPDVDSENRDNVYYKGPFYVDIDRKDLADSIESAQLLLERIRFWGIPGESYQIFCSGSKGFHFYFHPKLFYSGRPMRRLPEIYRRLASDFYVAGLDYAVYCGGKGNLFWLPNVKKDDGSHKRFITEAQLEAMTPEEYRALTSVPCVTDPPRLVAPVSTVPQLIQFFQEAEDYVLKKHLKKEDEVEEPLGEEALRLIAESSPPCIGCATNGDVRTGSTYNQVALQVATYLVDAKVDIPRRGAIIQQLAEKVSSSKYATTQDRVRHTEGLVQYLQHSKDRPFSCPAMRAVLAFRPCKECVIEDIESASTDHYDIEERKDGYYSLQGRTAKRITSFTLVPYKTIYTEDPTDHALRRAYTLCGIERLGETLTETVKLTEEAWLGRLNFIKELMGISNLSVVATDAEIQSLKRWVMRDTEKLEDQIEVKTVGVHSNEIKGKTRFTFVENGFSINKFGVPNTHVYPSNAAYNSSALPKIKNISLPDRSKYDYESIVTHLLNLNEPSALVPLLGWLGACHLKSQIMHVFHEFPLFVLWGGRGSGKTKTASVLTSALHACDYLRYPPMSVGQTSQFAIIDTVTSTTTVPRVLDEFNRHSCKPGHYDGITDIFKAGYNNSAIGRGRLTRPGERGRGGFGAVTDHFFVTSPLLLLAEHAPEVPALLDRSYLCMLREPSIRGRQGSMIEVTTNLEKFWGVAKALVLHALRVKPDMLLEDYLEWGKLVHPAYPERQAHTRKVIGLGLQHLEQVLVSDLKLSVADEMRSVVDGYRDLIGQYESVAEHAGYQTEIDRILMALAGFITLHRRRGDTAAIPRGMYEIDHQRGFLYLDVPTAYCVLEDHYAARRESLPIRQSQQFERILTGEKYFVGKELRESMVPTRQVSCLSLAEMKKKGMDVSLFLG